MFVSVQACLDVYKYSMYGIYLCNEQIFKINFSP